MEAPLIVNRGVHLPKSGTELKKDHTQAVLFNLFSRMTYPLKKNQNNLTFRVHQKSDYISTLLKLLTVIRFFFSIQHIIIYINVPLLLSWYD